FAPMLGRFLPPESSEPGDSLAVALGQAGNRLDAIADPEPAEYLADVELDRVRPDIEVLGNLVVAVAARDQRQHLDLPRCERDGLGHRAPASRHHGVAGENVRDRVAELAD